MYIASIFHIPIGFRDGERISLNLRERVKDASVLFRRDENKHLPFRTVQQKIHFSCSHWIQMCVRWENSLYTTTDTIFVRIATPTMNY